MGKIINANEAEFQSIIDSETSVVLVDFWADWCGPCRVLSPILEDVSEEVEDITIVKVNVDDNPGLSAAFSIRSIPTVISFKGGEFIDKFSGVKSKGDIIEFIKKSNGSE